MAKIRGPKRSKHGPLESWKNKLPPLLYTTTAPFSNLVPDNDHYVNEAYRELKNELGAEWIRQGWGWNRTEENYSSSGGLEENWIFFDSIMEKGEKHKIKVFLTSTIDYWGSFNNGPDWFDESLPLDLQGNNYEFSSTVLQTRFFDYVQRITDRYKDNPYWKGYAPTNENERYFLENPTEAAVFFDTWIPAIQDIIHAVRPDILVGITFSVNRMYHEQPSSYEDLIADACNAADIFNINMYPRSIVRPGFGDFSYNWLKWRSVVWEWIIGLQQATGPACELGVFEAGVSAFWDGQTPKGLIGNEIENPNKYDGSEQERFDCLYDFRNIQALHKDKLTFGCLHFADYGTQEWWHLYFGGSSSDPNQYDGAWDRGLNLRNYKTRERLPGYDLIRQWMSAKPKIAEHNPEMNPVELDALITAYTNKTDLTTDAYDNINVTEAGRVATWSNSKRTYTGQEGAIARFINGCYLDGSWQKITSFGLMAINTESELMIDLITGEQWGDGNDFDLTHEDSTSPKNGKNGINFGTTGRIFWKYIEDIPLDSDIFVWINTAPDDTFDEGEDRAAWDYDGSAEGPPQNALLDYSLRQQYRDGKQRLVFSSRSQQDVLAGGPGYSFDDNTLYTVRGEGSGQQSTIKLLKNDKILRTATTNRYTNTANPTSDIVRFGGDSSIPSDYQFDNGGISFFGWGKAGIVDTQFMRRVRRLLYDLGVDGLEGQLPVRRDLAPLMMMPFSHGRDGYDETTYESGYKMMRDFGNIGVHCFPVWAYQELYEPQTPGDPDSKAVTPDQAEDAYDWSKIEEHFRLMRKYRFPGIHFIPASNWVAWEEWPNWWTGKDDSRADLLDLTFQSDYKLYLTALCTHFQDEGYDFEIHCIISDTFGPAINWWNDTDWESFRDFMWECIEIVRSICPHWYPGVSMDPSWRETDGSVPSDEVLARWIELVGDGKTDYISCTWYPDYSFEPDTWEQTWKDFIYMYHTAFIGQTGKPKWNFAETGFLEWPGVTPLDPDVEWKTKEFNRFIIKKIDTIKDVMWEQNTFTNIRFALYELPIELLTRYFDQSDWSGSDEFWAWFEHSHFFDGDDTNEGIVRPEQQWAHDYIFDLAHE